MADDTSAQNHMELAHQAWQRFLHANQLVDINDSITHIREAHALIQADTIEYYNVCVDLGCRLLVRWVQFPFSRTIEDASEATGLLIYVLRKLQTYDPARRANHVKDIAQAMGIAVKSGRPFQTDIGVVCIFIEACKEAWDSNGELVQGVIFIGSCAAYYYAMDNQRTIMLAFELASSDDLTKWVSGKDIPACQSFLGELLRMRYERVGNIVDLNRAAQISQKACDAPPGDSVFSLNLSCSLASRYKATGNLNYLEEAIRLTREVLESDTDDLDLQSKADNNLSVLLQYSYQERGALADLETGIEHAKKSVNTSPDKTTYASRLNNLSTLWARHYERTADLESLNKAINIEKIALEVAPTHPDLHQHLNNLAVWFVWRYEAHGGTNLADLESASEMEEKAIHSVRPTSPDMAVYQTNLCGFLRVKYEHSKCLGDLRRGIEVGMKALQTLSPISVTYLRCVSHLGYSLVERNQANDIEEAIKLWNGVLATASFPPVYRVNLAVEAFPMLKKHGKYYAALEIAKSGIHLLAKASPRSIQGSDQQHILRKYAGFPSDAAALALECHDSNTAVADAVALLEEGRGILADHEYQARQELTRLKAAHLNEAAQFEGLIFQLNNIPSSSESYEAIEAKLREADRMLNALIERIRCFDGFKMFLRPPSTEQLYAISQKSGQAIVMINISFRCDALIIHNGVLRSVRLPSVYESVLREWVWKWDTSGAHGCYQVLEHLWKTITFPILENLGFQRILSEEASAWPRICWIPTGTLIGLPLHAAGLHRKKDGQTVTDWAVSSYSVSVKELIHLYENVQNARHETNAKPAALLVAMPKTPNLRRLPNTSVEVAKIQTVLEKTYTTSSLTQGIRQAVLSQLLHSHIFHFAGHGKVDASDASKSALILWDGDITVTDFLSLRLQTSPPKLAYLSACNTGVSGLIDLADEGMHTMGAWQIAGFQNVIGTLWNVSDEFSMQMALAVYLGLQDNPDNLAGALHSAVRRGRDAHLPDIKVPYRDGIPVRRDDVMGMVDPRQWTAYVHMGM